MTSLRAWGHAPINPAWIIDGSPITRAAAEATVGALSSGFWDCTAGHFDWHYGSDEAIYIIEGGAMVRDRAAELSGGGGWRELHPGDSITFPAGSSYEWIVPRYIHKFWVIGPRPSLLQRLIRRVRS